MKRLCADDSADARVKVGHRQAAYPPQTPSADTAGGVLAFGVTEFRLFLTRMLKLGIW